MHPNVLSSVIYSSQYMEATYVSINRRLAKETVFTHTLWNITERARAHTHTHTYTHTHSLWNITEPY